MDEAHDARRHARKAQRKSVASEALSRALRDFYIVNYASHEHSAPVAITPPVCEVVGRERPDADAGVRLPRSIKAHAAPRCFYRPPSVKAHAPPLAKAAAVEAAATPATAVSSASAPMRLPSFF